MKRIAYIGGQWSTNIGNAFFDLGADYVLKQVFGEENVSMIFDASGYMPGWNRNNGLIPQAINYWAHLNVDYVVLLGPMLSRYFLPIWKDTLNILKQRGVRYMLLSAGIMKSDERVVSDIKAFFHDNPPFAMTTRDTDTVDVYKDCVPQIYDGICFAFFAKETYSVVPTNLKPYIVSNFDKIDEPEIFIDENRTGDVSFEFNNNTIGLKFKGIFSKVGLRTDRFTDAIVYAMCPLPRGCRTNEVGGYSIIRTDHRFTPTFLRKIYRYDNSFCADIPQTYMNIYAEAELTLSDRVHACAMTLSYGNYAYLFAKTNRSALLERVGANEITDHPVKIDLVYLENEKQKLLRWMKSIEW